MFRVSQHDRCRSYERWKKKWPNYTHFPPTDICSPLYFTYENTDAIIPIFSRSTYLKPLSMNQVRGFGLTRALLGGGAFERPPSGFSRIAKKRRRAAPPGFHPPYPPYFPQLLWKFRPDAMWGQVTRSGQVTQLQNNFPIAARLQCFRESYETFGIWWGHQCLQNVYLGFLISVTSGQVIFATSPL